MGKRIDVTPETAFAENPLMPERTFTGFGFGAIQAGLFLYEAYRSGKFSRLVVAEVMPEVVAAVRRSGGCYKLNVAAREGIRRHEVAGVEILNPRQPADLARLTAAVAESSEIATALPSVASYGRGEKVDVASILAAGLERKAADPRLPAAVIFTAENHNRAAEILEESLAGRFAPGTVQCLNTVIGKMSGVVTDRARIERQGLAPLAPTVPRAFLVEEFNRILIGRIRLPGFHRAITVFEEKEDLLPFEEAKLYGHNATHALLGYLLRLRGAEYMAEATGDRALTDMARSAFMEESGGALCRKYAGLDPLFTPAGYGAYVDDLMARMLNPWLRDAVERVTRDPRRKLGWNDRLVGTMRLALSQGIEPHRYARGAAAALMLLLAEQGGRADAVLDAVWSEPVSSPEEKDTMKQKILRAMQEIRKGSA